MSRERQAFLYVAAAGLVATGGGILLQKLGLLPEDVSRNLQELPDDLAEFFANESKALKTQLLNATPEPTLAQLVAPTEIIPTATITATAFQPILPEDIPTNTPEPSPTPDMSFRFGNILFNASFDSIKGKDLADYEIENFIMWNGKRTQFIFNLNDGTGIACDFSYPFMWYPDIEKSRFFKVKFHTSIAWQDEANRIGLWAHSGTVEGVPLAMWQIQKYMEEDIYGNRYTSSDFALKRQNILGSTVYVDQDGVRSAARVIALARIPPPKTAEFEGHIMDMATHIAQNYPDSGFDRVLASDKRILMPRFCGRIFSDEHEIPGVSPYQQTRFVLGLELI